MSNHDGKLPTLEEIENVWNLPEAPDPLQDDATHSSQEIREYKKAEQVYKRAVDVLVWWIDSFMEKAAGLEFWGPTVRPFRLMTDKILVDGDPSGKEKVLVTVTSEAFAHLMFKNHRDKWVADYELKKNNRKAKIPKYVKEDVSTHKHQNRWSSSRTGQVQCGGWAKEAFDYFEKKKKDVQKFRREEEGRNYSTFLEAQQMIRVANDIKLDETEANGGKKRKRAQVEDAEKPVEVVDLVEILDE